MAASRQNAALQAGTGERAVSLSPASRALNALKRCKFPHRARFSEQAPCAGVDVGDTRVVEAHAAIGVRACWWPLNVVLGVALMGSYLAFRRKSFDGSGQSTATTRVIHHHQAGFTWRGA